MVQNSFIGLCGPRLIKSHWRPYPLMPLNSSKSKLSSFGLRGNEVPVEAITDIALDDPVKDINPKTWAVCGFIQKPVSPSLSCPTELSMSNKFKLAFVERDTSLAPKRAKNARQHQHCERENG